MGKVVSAGVLIVKRNKRRGRHLRDQYPDRQGAWADAVLRVSDWLIREDRRVRDILEGEAAGQTGEAPNVPWLAARNSGPDTGIGARFPELFRAQLCQKLVDGGLTRAMARDAFYDERPDAVRNRAAFFARSRAPVGSPSGEEVPSTRIGRPPEAPLATVHVLVPRAPEEGR